MLTFQYPPLLVAKLVTFGFWWLGTEDKTVVPFFDATDLFFDEKGNPTANVKGYPFEIAAQNHMHTGDFTPANVDFTIVTSRE